MPHIKKNDVVVVLAGKSSGVRGKVLGVEPKKGRVTVDGVNVVRRHMKKGSPRFQQGGIIEKTLPIHVSNVMLVCPKCNKPTRAAVTVNEDGSRHRVCRHCQEQF